MGSDIVVACHKIWLKTSGELSVSAPCERHKSIKSKFHIDGLVQEKRNSSALAMCVSNGVMSLKH